MMGALVAMKIDEQILAQFRMIEAEDSKSELSVLKLLVRAQGFTLLR